MTLLFAIGMGALALAPLLVLLTGVRSIDRLAALCSAVGCVMLVIVGLAAALGGASPVLQLGDWLGFGQSALRADGLAGIFLALTGLTGAAVSLAYVGLPAGRWLAGLGSTLLLFVAVAIGSDNAFLFLLAWEAITVCIYLLASAGGDRADLLAGYLTGGLAKIGGAALLAAFGLLYAHTHSFSLEVWAHAVAGGHAQRPVRAVPRLLRHKGRRDPVAGRIACRIRLGTATGSRLAVGRVVRRVLRTVAL